MKRRYPNKPDMSTCVHEAAHAVAHLAHGLGFIRVYVHTRAKMRGPRPPEETGCVSGLSPLEQKQRLAKRGKRITYRSLHELSVIIAYAGSFAAARYLRRGFGPIFPDGGGEDFEKADNCLKYIEAADYFQRFRRKRNAQQRLEAHSKAVREDLIERTQFLIWDFWPEIMALAEALYRRGSLTYAEAVEVYRRSLVRTTVKTANWTRVEKAVEQLNWMLRQLCRSPARTSDGAVA